MGELGFKLLAREVMKSMGIVPFDIDRHWALFKPAFDRMRAKASDAVVKKLLKAAIQKAES